MNDFIWQTYHRLVSETDTQNKRFVYEKIDHQKRLTGIIGPRGVGKTTMLLQYLKENLYHSEKAIYFSADNTYFNEVSILSFIDHIYQNNGIRYVFIDEIHKYQNWSQELKNLYDSFPKLNIIFSGSSSIDLITGAYDLSRRAKLLHLPGMSFREYLNAVTNNNFSKVTLDELLQNQRKITEELSKVSTIMQHFNEYLAFGYYPIIFEGRESLYETLNLVIEKTVYEDIARFYSLKTNNLQNFRRIINFLASIPPGSVKTNNLAKHLNIDNKTADNYLEILRKTGMVKMLCPAAHGNQILAKPSKIYLDNTTLLAASNSYLLTEVNKGSMRELAFLQFISGAGLTTFFPKVGDFQIDDKLFEVGGKNKTWQQLKGQKQDKFLVQADKLFGHGNEIPLYLFGFLY